MGYYVFFKSGLFPEAIPMRVRWRERRRSFLGVALYAAAGLLAFVPVTAALVRPAGIAFLFVIPNLMGES